MGIESDKVVYEYLSAVGDVAQQRQLPSASRMRLVSELRGEIERRRAKATVDSPAAVRRIISRLGSPDEVVKAAGGSAAPVAPATPAHVPVQRDDEPYDEPNDGKRLPRSLRRVVPRPRPAKPEPHAPPSDVPSPPHLASAAELGGSATHPDWWRVDNTRFEDSLPTGFVGGVEIPDLLKPPRPKEEEPQPAPAVEKAEAEAEVVEDAPAPRRRLSLPAGGWSNPLLLLAAGLLVVGAILGNWFALLLGWLIAYASRRLTQNESKWAVIGMPGIAVAAGLVWLWGRNDGRWGDPIAQGHMNDAIAQTWPWVVRGAAVLSALFVVWRSQRRM
ncbi:hypothetical protein [Streptomyces cylindrosporus]|uniref:Integral membrane protein n=1 Tax=Streptomyces cylindrosporus TaxID=2927583 RepID=A0ABS9Y4T0_9ACTN|nr:hypothetical protein [Streptomyces cylindrosporus]MCI3272226.1 hypothetical protein [Streptomyces cylindrosporus]